jgi:hypothetical protein
MFSRISSVSTGDTAGSGDCGSGVFRASADYKGKKAEKITWVQHFRREPRV